MKIVISESLWVDLPPSFGQGFDVQYNPDLVNQRAELLSLGAGTEAIVIRNRTQVDAEFLTAYPDLKVVGRLGVGLDNIDLSACRDRGVQVIAARGSNATSVAEYVLACLFDHARFLQSASAEVKRGEWNRGHATGHEVFNKTLGLIGVGDIGQRVAYRARALGLNVMAFDPFVLSASMIVQDLQVQLVSLDKLLRDSDYVSIHVPLTKETRHLLGRDRLESMKKSAVLINTARGGIIDEAAMLTVWRDSPQRVAYLDVREQEPSLQDDPLLKLANVIVTPHVAGITHESSERVAGFILEQVERALCGRPVQGTV